MIHHALAGPVYGHVEVRDGSSLGVPFVGACTYEGRVIAREVALGGGRGLPIEVEGSPRTMVGG